MEVLLGNWLVRGDGVLRVKRVFGARVEVFFFFGSEVLNEFDRLICLKG